MIGAVSPRRSSWTIFARSVIRNPRCSRNATPSAWRSETSVWRPVLPCSRAMAEQAVQSARPEAPSPGARAATWKPTQSRSNDASYM